MVPKIPDGKKLYEPNRTEEACTGGRYEFSYVLLFLVSCQFIHLHFAGFEFLLVVSKIPHNKSEDGENRDQENSDRDHMILYCENNIFHSLVFTGFHFKFFSNFLEETDSEQLIFAVFEDFPAR